MGSGHRVGHRLGIGPRIGRRHLDRRRRDLRILGDRQPRQRHQAEDHDHHREHRGGDRPIDEETREHASILFHVPQRRLIHRFSIRIEGLRDSPRGPVAAPT